MSQTVMPEGFRPLDQEGFLGHLAGLATRRHHDGVDVFLQVQPHHLNPNGTVHGGVLLSMLDFTLGATAEQMLTIGEVVDGGAPHPATISLTTQFMAGARPDSPLTGTAVVQRRTRSISFVSGELRSGDTLVATATAVFKNPPSPQR